MTREEKRLLLRDLCARLPYSVVVRCTDNDTDDYNCFLTTDILHEIQIGYEYYDYKPYLRPMSSMTEEEKVKYITLTHYNVDDDGKPYRELTVEAIDWLNAIHVDYRGLIPMGLALKAPKDMYKTE